MKNNVLLVLFVVVISIGCGIGLLFGIGNVVALSVNPINGHLMQVADNQRVLSEKLNALEKKVDLMEDKIKQQPLAAAPAMPQQPPSEDLNKIYEIPVGVSPVFGKKDAPVTVVEFSDLQCPFCARFYPPLKEAIAAYPDRVNMILKNFPLPFHPNARPAAKLAFAANEQGKYFEMVETLLKNGAEVDDAKIKVYATALGLNADKLAADYKNKDAQWEAQIAADEKLAEEVDVRGTPTFFINGKKTNARDVNSWKAAFNQAQPK